MSRFVVLRVNILDTKLFISCSVCNSIRLSQVWDIWIWVSKPKWKHYLLSQVEVIPNKSNFSVRKICTADHFPCWKMFWRGASNSLLNEKCLSSIHNFESRRNINMELACDSAGGLLARMFEALGSIPPRPRTKTERKPCTAALKCLREHLIQG